MNRPLSLAARAHLLAYDPVRARFSTGRLHLVVSAAVLAELYLDGRLADEDGRARVRGPARSADPLADAVRARIAASDSPRKWKYWITKDAKGTLAAVRAELAAAGTAEVTTARLLGVLPLTKVRVMDAPVVTDLQARVTEALRTSPVSRVAPPDAALTALAAAGRFHVVGNAFQRRDHKEQLRRLAEVAGPVVPALRRAISEAESSG